MDDRAIHLKTVTDTPTQTAAASAELQCPLAPSKACQQALWCDDKVRQGQARLRALRESRAAGVQPGTESALQARAFAARADRTRLSCAPADRVSLQRSRSLHLHEQSATQASRAARYGTDRRRVLLHLRWLESLQALARARCWLLRNFLCPFLRSRNGNDRGANNGGQE